MKSSNQLKVYCINCKYLKVARMTFGTTYYCRFQQRKEITMMDNSIVLSKNKQIFYGDPIKLNKKNNCPHYKRKWWKWWV